MTTPFVSLSNLLADPPSLTDTPLLLIVAATLGLIVAGALLWARRRKRPKWIVLDGSNIMHWKDGTPQIQPLYQVIRHLESLGYAPGVVFDANAGYLIAGKYQHDSALGKRLKLPVDRVMVVPKGTPADPFILTAARDMQAPIVTNDRFRDWAQQFPEVQKPGLLIQGGYRAGQLWLKFD
ncbi:hypothetical protein K3727_14255 [Rhodobacteraceae bacterium M382]|nr:hypothetical protein K3727_14255 [Rhodobacteraceae bacterium M382]